MLILLIAIHQVSALANAPFRALKRGANPPGYNYYLPEGAKWNGGAMFVQNHYFPPVVDATQCVDNSGTTYCITEKARYLNVTTDGQTFPSHCWYADCYVQVHFPNFTLPSVVIPHVTSEPMFTMHSAPYLPEQQCHGSSLTMLAPGSVYSSLELYHICLVIHLEITIIVAGKEMQSTQVIFNTLSITDTGKCDSFITHRL